MRIHADLDPNSRHLFFWIGTYRYVSILVEITYPISLAGTVPFGTVLSHLYRFGVFHLKYP
jgi:hypothetical protein